ncbi:MAG: 3-methyl-2-oxobutanoate hydroxymethyltransferase [Candidatus Bathyarchaeota archaeon]|nr:MAG: 3-methyl-2-oxobutanoate hydroxymethyltransferase [Candidatus Bathyarchaeota archaeon]
MLTAYDYLTARILDQTPIDLILVGDSLAMTFQGHINTKKVTMSQILYHSTVVARGAEKIPVIGDMPIASYSTPTQALRNAKRLLKTGTQGIKIEGNHPNIVQSLIDAEIPVMGHVGLLPQTAESYQVQGKEEQAAELIFQDALELDESGVFSMVLECIPETLARRITENINAPTIGIGAGKFCDGQVLVISDVLGLDDRFTPKFLKRYANLNETMRKAVELFSDEVRSGVYPDDEHTYH